VFAYAFPFRTLRTLHTCASKGAVTICIRRHATSVACCVFGGRLAQLARALP
jgi:hypothetical protein